jgi:hypothetical protein
MSRLVLRIAAGFLCIVQIAAGVSLAFMYEGLWHKICSISIAIMGLYYGLYAVRGTTQLRRARP